MTSRLAHKLIPIRFDDTSSAVQIFSEHPLYLQSFRFPERKTVILLTNEWTEATIGHLEHISFSCNAPERSLLLKRGAKHS
jgi:hypothetical protein